MTRFLSLIDSKSSMLMASRNGLSPRKQQETSFFGDDEETEKLSNGPSKVKKTKVLLTLKVLSICQKSIIVDVCDSWNCQHSYVELVGGVRCKQTLTTFCILSVRCFKPLNALATYTNMFA